MFEHFVRYNHLRATHAPAMQERSVRCSVCQCLSAALPEALPPEAARHRTMCERRERACARERVRESKRKSERRENVRERGRVRKKPADRQTTLSQSGACGPCECMAGVPCQRCWMTRRIETVETHAEVKTRLSQLSSKIACTAPKFAKDGTVLG